MKTYRKLITKLLLIPIGLLIIHAVTFAAVPPLRTQVSLNGQWVFKYGDSKKTTIKVPALWDQDSRFDRTIKEADYEKVLTAPTGWLSEGKRVIIDFEGVLQAADVFINDKLVTSHVGGWIPFSADITDFIKPGIQFTLRVHIKGGALPPTVDEKGFPLWPTGALPGTEMGHRIRRMASQLWSCPYQGCLYQTIIS